ncbi:TRAP transporter substrate-binding protein [Lentibacter algarum]|uniref:TRAP transporter substrate-binding protein n=1 Tax=Lentibacter algarum TaxID=576131 RepID=UPI001C09B603|nr:TRAP transporter substrate-binding protein [Lentibacter algarum]MBU2982821.1 TRAP transporter substrate-binding protein [Lentibacter algarum]
MKPFHQKLNRRAVLAGGAAAAAVMATGTSASAATKLRLAHVAPTQSAYQQSVDYFTGHLKTLTNGEILIESHAGGTLGGLKQLWAQLRVGVIDFHLIDPAAMAVMKEAATFRVVSQPYLFDDLDHWRRYIKSDLFASQMDEVEKATNIKWIGYMGDRAPRGISSAHTRVETLADMKGLRLRTIENPITIASFKAWGANPIPMSSPEVYNAIETGMVEGQDNGIIDTVNLGYIPVTKYYTELNSMFSGIGLWMSGAKFNMVGSDVQAAMAQAITLTQKDMATDFAANEAKARKAMTDAGIEIIQPERQAFQDAVQETAQDMDGKVWPEGLLAKIQAI